MLLLGACSPAKGGPPVTATVQIRTDAGRVAVHARVADTDASRQRGLAGVRHLPDQRGMAFLFDHPIPAAFWMKDTLIPLSIAFWTPDGRIVAMEDMTPCPAGPCARYRAPAPVAGALEVNLGFFQRHGVEVGDRVELSGF